VSKGFFSNCFLNGIDGKNRLSIPSDYRAAVTARSGTRDLVIAPSRIAPCLLGYDETFFTQLKAEHDARHANQVSRERDRDDPAAPETFAPVLQFEATQAEPAGQRPGEQREDQPQRGAAHGIRRQHAAQDAGGDDAVEHGLESS
jgi:hypothetical protein